MVPAELVPHLVGHVVDVERVADRAREAGLAAGLLPGAADDREAGEATTTRREDVADVVVRVADHAVDRWSGSG